MEALFIVGRITLGVLAIVAGLSHFVKIRYFTSLARGNKVPFAPVFVFATGVALILSGLGVMLWYYIEASLWFLAFFFLFVALFMHRFWSKPTKGEKITHFRLFLWNMMLAGLLFITLAVI